MRLGDAQALCQEGHAKLVARGDDNPLVWAYSTPDGFGTLYIWTQGHSIPTMQTQRVADMPKAPDQEVCSCGLRHNFPAMWTADRKPIERVWRLWMSLQSDEAWEPVFEIGILDAIAKDPDQAP
ncbi:MAG: hypothetical protein AB7L09_02750 [Nitrospira sp.]